MKGRARGQSAPRQLVSICWRAETRASTAACFARSCRPRPANSHSAFQRQQARQRHVQHQAQERPGCAPARSAAALDRRQPASVSARADAPLKRAQLHQKPSRAVAVKFAFCVKTCGCREAWMMSFGTSPSRGVLLQSSSSCGSALGDRSTIMVEAPGLRVYLHSDTFTTTPDV